MGYEYDSQVNRELAKTAMDIYKKAHNIDQPINESTQNLNEEAIRENVNGLIMNYISDVIILAEAQMGREMTDIEINEASDELLRRIDSISDADKVAFINELSEAAGNFMTPAAGMGSAPSSQGTVAPTRGGRGDGMGTARPGAAKPGVGMRPTAGGPSVGAGPGAGPGAVAPGRPPADVGGPGLGAADTTTAVQNPAVARLFASAAYQQALADGDFSAAGQMLANVLAGQQQQQQGGTRPSLGQG